MVKNTNLNELYISSKEFEALNKCDSEIRYSYTLKFYEDGIPILIIIKSKNQYEKSNIYNCHYLSFITIFFW